MLTNLGFQPQFPRLQADDYVPFEAALGPGKWNPVSIQAG